MSEIKDIIESAFENRASITASSVDADTKHAVLEAIAQLNSGSARVAEKIAGEWVVHQWLKKAVLLYFRINENDVMDGAERPAEMIYYPNDLQPLGLPLDLVTLAPCHLVDCRPFQEQPHISI